MDFSSMRIFSMMKSGMNYDEQKMKLLSTNIANADTPGFRSMEMKKPDFEKMATGASHKLQMANTASGHVHGTGGDSTFRTARQDSTFETSPTKNNVSIEQQMAEVAYTNVNHTMMTDLYKKHSAMIKMALGQR